MEQQKLGLPSTFGSKVTADTPIGLDDEARERLRNKKSVRQQWVLAVQWSDCPVEVEEEVRQAWTDYELGNDNYFFMHTVGGFKGDDKYPLVSEWCRHNGVPDGESVWVSWWW